MENPMRRLVITLLLASVSASAIARDTPIRSQAQALRAVIVADNLQFQVPGFVDTFMTEPRYLTGSALRMLAAATTPELLAGVPAGLTLDCAVSGTLNARMSQSRPRVVQLEWHDCNFDTPTSGVLNGPAEIVLTTSSFDARVVASIRLGDRNRDLTQSFTPEPNPRFGPSVSSYNLRITGVIPLAEEENTLAFPGRFFVAFSGFVENATSIRDFPNPGPPFYPQIQTITAENVVATGENSNDATSSLTDYRVVTGRFSEHIEVPPRPLHPDAVSVTQKMRFANLHVRRGSDSAAMRNFFTVDGRVEADVGEFNGFPGCVATETFAYRTRSPITSDPLGVFPNWYDGGTLEFNAANVRFSQSGTEPFVDLVMHMDFTAPHLGAFRIDSLSGLSGEPQNAGCSP
jgi:hypothetical protein